MIPRFVKSFVWGYIANKAATGIVTTAGNTINVAVGDTALYFSPILYATPAALNDAIQEHKRFALFLSAEYICSTDDEQYLSWSPQMARPFKAHHQ